MGKKSKTGKSRKDKFYHLAKETGYRARSAFKLIQLNRKYEFLQKSRVVIDLCAAPGGWLQVVAENTPVSSLIIGVDLMPIRPIHNCKTLIEDITTEKCRQALKKELQTWKADSIIHDGAPNVGKNWLHDAFQQAQLTLQALKLATEFLKKGGWFVTKVFRSKDYNSLLWVFQQLFTKVHATKPQASRNESAEIFVVCEKFIAPDKIDPKFLDPKFVFKEVEAEPRQQINLIHPEKKRRQRDGYADGDYTLHHTVNVSEYISSKEYLTLLAGANEVIMDDAKIANLPETTEEIKMCFSDIQVLGKKDIKSLITWRKTVRNILGMEEKAKQEKVKEKVEEERDEIEDEEAEIEQQLAEAKEDERKALKRKLKKIRKEKTKLRHKMDMKMVIPGDKHDFADDVGLFYLEKLKNKKHLEEVEAGDSRLADEFVAEEFADKSLTHQQKIVTYDKEGQKHLDIDPYSSEEEEDINMLEEPELDDNEEEELEFEDEDEDEKESNPLIVELESEGTKTQKKLSSWFNKDSFAGLENEADEDVEIEKMMEDYKRRGGTITESKKQLKAADSDKDSGMSDDSDNDDDDDDVDDDDDDDDSDSDSESDYDTRELMKPDEKDRKTKTNKSGFEEVPKEDLGCVGKALGTALVSSRKRRRELIDSGYNKYMFDDVGLPEWFVKDESKHCKIQLPVSKGEIEEYKLKERSIDARPIKKIAEAKARKKKKEMRKLERARKKADSISETVDLSERDKWQQIKQVYKKAGLLSQKKKEVTYVFAKRGAGKKVSRPAGVQGPFKVVDKRMKKDNKQQKKQQKMKGKKGRKSSGKRKK